MAFVLPESRVVQLLQNQRGFIRPQSRAEASAHSGTKFWVFSIVCGSAFWPRGELGGGEKKRRKENASSGRSRFCTRIKELGQKHITLHFCHIQLAISHVVENQ